MKAKNIIFLLSDDQGAWSLAPYGNPDVVAPALDRMAAEGVCFENFYCTSPVCSPARASIFTGEMPSQHGVLDWLGGGAVRKDAYRDLPLDREKALTDLIPEVRNDPSRTTVTYQDTVNYHKYMNYEHGPIDYLAGHPFFTELLQQHGYTCGIAGKWHLGNAMEAQKGFSFWRVVPRGGTPYQMPDRVVDGKPVISYGYSTDVIMDDAMAFLEERPKDRPFYLSVHFTAPHDPWRKEDHPQELWDLYEGCDFSSMPNLPLHPDQVLKRSHPTSPEHRMEMIRAHFAAISGMDRQIARLMEALEASGELENTVVFFTADNGVNLGQHGIWGKGNGTFPMNLYETSVKVPFLACGGGLPRGARVRSLCSHYDIFQTVLDIAGIPAPEGALPGESLLPLLEEPDRERDVVVCDEYGPVRMIRAGDWKLIYQYPYGPHYLFNLADDPEEAYNRISDPACQTVAQSLFQRLESWFGRYSCPQYDGRRFPVDGEGQMERLESYGSDKTVFLKYGLSSR